MRRIRPRTLIVTATGVIVALWAIRHVWLAATAQPAPVIDYGNEIEALAASHQPEGADGWALFVEGTRHLEPVSAEFDSLQRPGNEWLDFRLVVDGPLDTDLVEPEMRALARLEERGAFDLLRRAAACPRAVRRSDWATPLMQHVPYGELRHVLGMADALAARARLAASRGDVEERVDSFDLGLAMARGSASQALIVDRLGGVAIARKVLGGARADLLEYGIVGDAGRRMLEALDRCASLPPPSLAFEGERLLVRDSIQWLFTDDGHGDGRLRADAIEAIADASPGGFAAVPLSSRIGGLLLAGRAETTQLVDEWYGGWASEARLLPGDRGSFDPAAFTAKLTWRDPFLRVWLQTADMALREFDRFSLELAATRVHLAIEIFRAENGRLPERLDELAPSILEEVPRDPTHGGSFVYRRLAAADAHGRTYVLGSRAGAPDPAQDGALIASADALDLARDFTEPRPER